MRTVTVTENPNRIMGEISFDERLKELEAQERKQAEQIKLDRKSVYTNFAQVNCDEYRAMDKLASYAPAMRIYNFIVFHMDGYNALIASYKVFEEALGISIPTITRAIKYLKDSGILYIAKSGSANVYLINPRLAWKSWGNNMKYCKFPTNIILAGSEQTPNADKVFSNQMHKVVETKQKNKK